MDTKKINTKIYKLQPCSVGYKEFKGISTVMDIKDEMISHYEALLPRPLEVPSRPFMLCNLRHFTKVFPWPMPGYLEAAMCIRAKYPGSEEGWYVLSMPASSFIACATGKRLGYPKYIPDQQTLEPIGNDWEGKVTHAGKSPFTLKFSPGDVDVWWKDVFKKGDVFFIRDSHDRINQMQSVIQDYKIDDIKTGNVTISVDSDDEWSKLVPGSKQTVPGIFNTFVGKVALTRKDRKPLGIHDGGT